jgi:fructose-1-phosphate kinase PfkB-like protein
LPRPLANPIGAGDAVASGTLLRWCDTVPAAPAATTVGAVAELTEAFAWGLACGAASCLTTENSVFALDDALALRAAIVPRPQG